MNVSNLIEFARRGQRAQAAVDHAIARADLVAEVRRRRVLVAELQRTHADELADAEMRLGAAYLALDEFDHEGRAAR